MYYGGEGLGKMFERLREGMNFVVSSFKYYLFIVIVGSARIQIVERTSKNGG